MMTVDAFVQLIGSLFVVVSWLLFRRKYPDRLVIYFCLCLALFSARGVLNSFFTVFDITCLDQIHNRTSKDPLCMINGDSDSQPLSS